MAYKLKVNHWYGYSSSNIPSDFFNVEYPTKCPRCSHAIGPVYRYVYVHDFSLATIVFECNSCKKLFFTDYSCSKGYGDSLNFRYIIHSYPMKFFKKTFDDSISRISPNFIDIYNQSFEAESLNLDQVSGVGFRKSLEFLVKDYAIFLKQGDTEAINQIKKMALVQCIENYILHPRIEAIAKRAAWLGNDETHYVKKYTEEDIETLKSLIKLSVNWITLDLDSADLEDRIVHPSQLEKTQQD